MNAAIRFATAYALLTASHEIADHWVQQDTDAVRKGDPGPAGHAACFRHVAAYTAVQAAALVGGGRLLGLGYSPARAVTALAVSAVTHYAADRQAGHWGDEQPRGVARLGAAMGHATWLRRDPGAGYLMDQAWHKGWIGVAALVAAGRGEG